MQIRTWRQPPRYWYFCFEDLLNWVSFTIRIEQEGDTALLRAVRNRNLEIVQLLLDKKARVTAADKEGDTVLHIAMRARSKVTSKESKQIFHFEKKY